jgi:drug/metabolite transporter (DMT)-like permease
LARDQENNGEESTRNDGDLTDLLGELRVLLPGVQTLTAFLIILPFNSGFAEINGTEKVVYAITFICSLISLVCFTAPAAQHRLQRPLRDRPEFKEQATALIVAGLVPLSISLILACQLVLSQVIERPWVSWAVAGMLAFAIGALWWIMPVLRQRRLEEQR